MSILLSADGDADWFAPLTDTVIGDAIDGAVGPFRRRGRERHAVDIAGRGVVRQKDEAFGIVAIDFQLEHIEVGAVSIPAPIDLNAIAADVRFDLRFDRGEIGTGLLGAFDPEGLTDRRIIVTIRFDLFDERAETGFDSRRDGWHNRRKSRRDNGCAGWWRCTAVADKGFPTVPLLAAVLHHVAASEYVVEVIGVGRLRGNGGWTYAENGGVAADGCLEGLELLGEDAIAADDVIGLSHIG